MGLANSVVVVGAQWGDEGKGKIVDLLTEKVQVVVRFHGGNNAGHTLVVGDRRIVLHLIPSGVLHAGTRCLIGNGVVVDPEVLCQEIDLCKAHGALADDADLLLSDDAHVIMPYHKRLDQLREKRAGVLAIGTTGRGIGPTYEDKVGRRGIRVRDLCEPARLEKRLAERLPEANAQIVAFGGEPFDSQELLATLRPHAARLSRYRVDGSLWLSQAIEGGASVYVRGGAGDVARSGSRHLSLRPLRAASLPTPPSGAAWGRKKLGTLVGIAKAYVTRVGSGPFPTELHGAEGDRLRELGSEFGATTGRLRRWRLARRRGAALCHPRQRAAVPGPEPRWTSSRPSID